MSLSNPFSENGRGRYMKDTIMSNASEDPEAMLLLRERGLDYIERNGGELLSSFEQKVWDLYLKGVSYTEIAKLTNKTPKAVDNAITRAKRKLEPMLSR